ncbi:MAG: hypothetical protein CL398_12565 [Acidiferrobacteraceae bacterium]|nr:hypothetical protein [Acidiferrobacteraceae bacterium]
MTDPLLQVKHLKKYFRNSTSRFSKAEKWNKAIDGVSFSVNPGETVGLVGESGCGKSTLGRTIIGLYRPTAGKILFSGEELPTLGGRSRKTLSKRIQLIFQDPAGSLNPRRTIREAIIAPLLIHRLHSSSQRNKIVEQLIVEVGLDLYHLDRYPHELSGGQKQRVGIARALALEPDFLICDEPVSALDVSVQAQIINLLQDLKKKFGFSYLFISHDLSVVYHVSDRVLVMYLGRIVEIASYGDIYREPLHPYTQLLMSSNPVLTGQGTNKVTSIEGELSHKTRPTVGCSFSDRCPMVTDFCKKNEPELAEQGSNHLVACHLHST